MHDAVKEVATSVGTPLADLSGRLSEVLAGEGRNILDSGQEATVAMPAKARNAFNLFIRRARGDYTEDEWGVDDEFIDAVFPFFEFMYERYWRVNAKGIDNIPAHGRAMLVANHAGILPWDATMIAMAIMKHHPLPRTPRFMVLNWAFQLPFINIAMRKFGGVVASPYNALSLLERDHLVAVFPEGAKGAGKMFRDRYRLRRFGRGGFVEVALRTGSPIVPVAVVGSEEIHPMIGNLPAVGRMIGSPYFPITPTFPLLGALGIVPLPSRWRIEFCEPVDLSDYEPKAAEDRNLVFEISQAVRDTIQDKLYENLVARGKAFGLV